MIEDPYLLDKLKQNDLKTLDKVYITYRKDFFLFARTFSVSEEDIADIYQDSIISLYENIRTGKLEALTSSLKTYLFAVGRFKLYTQKRNNSKIYYDDAAIHSSEEVRLFDIDMTEERKSLLKDGMSRLGAKCQKILELYYYRGMTLDEIQKLLYYSTKDVLKNQKSRCLKQLKKFVKKSYG